MRTQPRMKRLVAAAVALMAMCALAFGALNTHATNYTEQTLYMTLYDTEPISVPNSSISSMSSSNSTIVSVRSFNSSSGTVYAQSPGSAYIYVTVTNNSTGYTDNYTIPVTVSSSGTSSGSNAIVGVNGTYVIGSFDNIINYYSSNTAVATVYAQSGILSAFGIGTGSCTITYTIRNSSGTLQSYSLYLSVVGQATLSPTPYNTSSNYTNATQLTAGKRYVTSVTYYSIDSVTVDDTSIATASTDSQGRLVINALRSGNTTIRYYYKTSSTSSSQSGSLAITVSGSSSSATPTPTSGSISTSGIAFKSYSVNVAVNKSYRIGTIYLNGDTVSADRLLWISNNHDVITVNATTGVFKCVGTGTAKLIAIDKDAKHMNSITVNVS